MAGCDNIRGQGIKKVVLSVPYGEFADAAKRLGISEAFLESELGTITLTACIAGPGHVLRTTLRADADKVQSELGPLGIAVYPGKWSAGDELVDGPQSTLWVAAVAYVSDKKAPGVWVDAYDAEPTPAQVLKAIYDEFRSSGELNEVSMEEFVRLAEPNVVIVPPTALNSFAEAKRAEPAASAAPADRGD